MEDQNKNVDESIEKIKSEIDEIEKKLNKNYKQNILNIIQNK